ncbi:MAG: DnaJ domain-containing protein [Myxococcota bacterium]|nr:DnaJ domain-containing protein [Myxococcota bacterium]
MAERTDPRALKKWLILAAIVYFLFPYDLLPDVLGLPGRIDDVLLVAWLAWVYRSRAKQASATGHEGGAEAGHEAQHEARHQRESASAGPRDATALDPYAVLGLAPSASREAIQSAYRARMHEYHPDKVAHLGEELQKLAHEKTQQIQHAYQQLRE